ncbi:MAG: DUF1080 domain-containing protein [Verrucomicrobium sp.]|nr:DUF1080 domain-containing protein [Verrucomicrobium sp.]
MKLIPLASALTVLASALFALPMGARAEAEKDKDKDGFSPLFNGKDLSGWVPCNVAQDTFRWEEGMVITTGEPTGFMRSAKVYENFIVELEWRHLKEAGNSGLFIWGEGLPAPGVPYARGIEVQILDLGYEKNKGANEWFTSHGDIFPIWGATMTPTGRVAKTGKRSFPTENRVKPSPEWNHYRVECRDGEIHLSVNGKEVTVGKDCVPRKGYICLESEGSEAHFRNVRIKELPSSNATPEQTARLYEGFQQLFDGKALGGWKVSDEVKSFWSANGATFKAKADPAAAGKTLWTEKAYGDFVLCVDWKAPKDPAVAAAAAATFGVAVRGSEKALSAEVLAKLQAEVKPGIWNRYFLMLKEDRLSVELNDKGVIENVTLTEVPAKGPVGLLHTGAAAEYSNLFIKDL